MEECRVATRSTIENIFILHSVYSWPTRMIGINIKDSQQRRCTSCKNTLGADRFKLARGGGLSKTCKGCSEKDARRRAAKKGLALPENSDSDLDEGDGTPDVNGLSNLTLDMFLGLIGAAQDELSLEAQVNISGLVNEVGNGKGLREYADVLAGKVWEKSQYRFM